MAGSILRDACACGYGLNKAGNETPLNCLLDLDEQQHAHELLGVGGGSSRRLRCGARRFSQPLLETEKGCVKLLCERLPGRERFHGATRRTCLAFGPLYCGTREGQLRLSFELKR